MPPSAMIAAPSQMKRIIGRYCRRRLQELLPTSSPMAASRSRFQVAPIAAFRSCLLGGSIPSFDTELGSNRSEGFAVLDDRLFQSQSRSCLVQVGSIDQKDLVGKVRQLRMEPNEISVMAIARHAPREDADAHAAPRECFDELEIATRQESFGDDALSLEREEHLSTLGDTTRMNEGSATHAREGFFRAPCAVGNV